MLVETSIKVVFPLPAIPMTNIHYFSFGILSSDCMDDILFLILDLIYILIIILCNKKKNILLFY